MSRFLGVEAWHGHDMLWWDYDNRRWRSDDEIAWGKNNPDRDYRLSSCAPCRSLKAFKRHLRRHGGKLAGHEVRLVSRFVGCDVTATASRRGGSAGL